MNFLMMGFLAVLAAPAGGDLESGMQQQIWVNVIAFLVSQPILGVLWLGAFNKANKPAVAAFIPIWREMNMCEMTDKPTWWAIMSVICPCVWLIMYILIMIEMANRFGQGGGFAVGLILLGIIFIPILSYGSSQYQGRRKRRSGGDYDDDDDRPRRRSRDDDDDDDRPRGRGRDDDDDDDRRVRRPRDDD